MPVYRCACAPLARILFCCVICRTLPASRLCALPLALAKRRDAASLRAMARWRGRSERNGAAAHLRINVWDWA